MLTRRTISVVAALVAIGGLAVAVHAGTVTTVSLTNGDSTYERVYFGYGGAGKENLSSLLSNYVDPLTGEPAPIVTLGGAPLVVGNVDLGEDPAASDQTQIQRFFTPVDQRYKLTYVGLGYASYLNVMGVYTYGEGDTLADFAFTPLVTQGIDPAGTEVLFDVAAGHYFGFYLSADGGRSERNRFFSENAFNLDGGLGIETDHMLAFETNRGLLLAWEDLPLGTNGLLGDQDYEDMVGGLLTYDDGTPLPEPATMALLGTGLGTMLFMQHRKRTGGKCAK